MSQLIPVGISGVGSYVPERVLSNHEIEKLVDTSDEWIVQRTGIRERRIARPDEASGDMGTMAARRALEDAKVDPADLDLVICATTTPDNPFPATACHIAKDIGAVRAGGFDNFGDYVKFVQTDATGDELVALLDAISTNHTSFYREPQHFDLLASKIAPGVGPAGLDIWSAACSSGEEPYTIAMTMATPGRHSAGT